MWRSKWRIPNRQKLPVSRPLVMLYLSLDRHGNIPKIARLFLGGGKDGETDSEQRNQPTNIYVSVPAAGSIASKSSTALNSIVSLFQERMEFKKRKETKSEEKTPIEVNSRPTRLDTLEDDNLTGPPAILILRFC